MAACTCYRETLLLDAHGELTTRDRIAWQRHLAQCDDCRHERERLCALIGSMQTTLSVPELTSEEQQRLSASMQRAVRLQTRDARPSRAGWLLAPAFAACMVIVVAGWFGLKNLTEHSSAVSPGRVPGQVTRTVNGRPAHQGPESAAATSAHVPEMAINTGKEPPAHPAPATAAVTAEPAPGDIITINKELLENMDLLKEMDELEQLVNLLDKQDQEADRLRTGGNGNNARVFA